MENQGGQVTVFVVIGILIVAGVILFFALRGNIGEERQIPQEAEPVQIYVQNCLDEVAEDIIEKVGINGGVYSSTEFVNDNRVHYFIYEEQKVMPPLNLTESEISRGIEQRLPFCIQDFFSFQEYNLKQGNIQAKTNIYANETRIQLNYPIEIRRGDFNYTLRKFESSIDVRLGTIYNSTDYLTDKEMYFLETEPSYGFDSVCWRCYEDMVGNNSLDMEIYPDFEKEEVLFVVEDNLSQINNKPFEFWYVNKYRE